MGMLIVGMGLGIMAMEAMEVMVMGIMGMEMEMEIMHILTRIMAILVGMEMDSLWSIPIRSIITPMPQMI